MREIIEMLWHRSFGDIHKCLPCIGDFKAINSNELSTDMVQNNDCAVSLRLDEVVASIGAV